MQSKVSQFAFIIAFIIVLLSLTTQVDLSGTVTGKTTAGVADDYEHSLEITADTSSEIITQEIVFDQYKPDTCAEGIAIYTGSGDEVSFETSDDQYNETSCLSTIISFSNSIYHEPVEEEPSTEPEDPTYAIPEPEEPVDDPAPTEPEEPEYSTPETQPEASEEAVAETGETESESDPLSEQSSRGLSEQSSDRESEPSGDDTQTQSEPASEPVPSEEPTPESIPEPEFGITGAVSGMPEGEQTMTYYIFYGKIVEAPVEEPTNETEEEPNETVDEPVNETNETINETINETVNETIQPINATINETVEPISNVTARVRTIQSNVTIFQPVIWQQFIEPDQDTETLEFEVPEPATNIKVTKIKETGEEHIIPDEHLEGVDLEDLDEFTIAANPVEGEPTPEETTPEHVNETVEPEEIINPEFSITGAVTSEALREQAIAFWNLFLNLFRGGITGFVVSEPQTELLEVPNKTITINENITPQDEIVIEYETPAPITTEEQTSFGKRVVVSSDIHYENVLTYTNIEQQVSESAIKLYWLKETQSFDNETNETTTFVDRTDVTNDLEIELWKLDTDGDGRIDYLEWITPHLSNETFEIELTILTVQSYPALHGNWTVDFNTTGTANLTIQATNGTTWSDEYNESVDLEFLNLTCGNESVNYSWINDTVFVEDYSCNETGFEISSPHTHGVHTIRFQFGDQVAYAYNSVTLNEFNYHFDGSPPNSVDNVQDVYLSGDLLYITSTDDDEVSILNVSDPTSIAALDGYVDTAYSFSVEQVHEVMVIGDLLYTISVADDNFNILNVSDPTAISTTGGGSYLDNSADGSIDNPLGMDIVGDLAYVTSAADDCLTIINVSNPTTVVGGTGDIGSLCDSTNLNTANEVVVSGDYAYVAAAGGGSQGLAIINVSDPTSPTHVAQYTNATEPLNTHSPYALDVYGDYVFLGAYSDGFSGIVVIDVSDPENPNAVASYKDEDGPDSIDGPMDVQVSGQGNYLYVASYLDACFTILDISDPATPTAVASYCNTTTIAGAYDIAISTDTETAFIAGSTASSGVVSFVNITGYSETTAGPPSMSSASILPAVPKTSDDLQGSCLATDNNDTVTYYYEWFKDDISDSSGSSVGHAPGSAVNLDNISAASTSDNEEWIFSCLADDGADNSSWMNSSTATVGNIPPGDFTAVTLASSSGANLFSDNLSVTWTESTDNNGDTVYNITDWRLNGSSIAVLNMPFESNRSGQAGAIVRDYSTQNTNGTFSGFDWDADSGWRNDTWCAVGGCYEFDGTDNYISLPNNAFDEYTQGTILLWVYPTDLSATGCMYSYGDDFNDAKFINFASQSSGKVRLALREDTSANDVLMDSDNNVLSQDMWNHVAVTNNGSTWIMYINGTEVPFTVTEEGTATEGMWFDDIAPSAERSCIGALCRDDDRTFFQGGVDEFQIYNRSLTPEQISEIYQAGVANHSIQNLNANETSADDAWTVAVTPNDLLDDGSTNVSNQLDILAVNLCAPASDVELTANKTCASLHIESGITVNTSTFAYSVTGDVFINGTLNASQGKNQTFRSLDINSGGTYHEPADTTKITSENSLGSAVDCDGTYVGNGGYLLINTNQLDTNIDLKCVSGSAHDLEIDLTNTGYDATVSGAGTGGLYLTGDLIIDDGELDTDNHIVNITGELWIQAGGYFDTRGDTVAHEFGAIDLDSSGYFYEGDGKIIIDSEASSYAIDCDGYWVDDASTTSIETNTNTAMDIYCQTTGYRLTNLDIKLGSSAYEVTTTTTMYIGKTLTIKEGALDTSVGYFGTHEPIIVIEDGGFLDLASNNNGINVESVDIQSGGSFTGPNNIISINASSGTCWNNAGTFTAASASTVEFDGGCTVVTGGTGTGNDFANVQFDGGTTTLSTNGIDVDGWLLLNGGSFDANGQAVTVVGDTNVTSGTLTGGAGAMTFGSLTIASGQTYSATSGTTTITSEATSGYAISHLSGGTLTANSGIINVTTSATTSLDFSGTGNPYTIEVTGGTKVWQQNTALDGNLTVSSGTFRANSAAKTLTVTGDVDVTGTLGGGSQTAANSFGSLTINSGGTYEATSGTTTITSKASNDYALDNDGTLTHNSGTVNITTGATTYIDVVESGGVYNLEVDSGNIVSCVNSAPTIAGNLTVSSGTFKMDSSSASLTATADVDVTGTLGDGSDSGAFTFGSLTINSGGTYSATSGTTTITGEAPSGFALDNDGTLTANSGLINITTTGSTFIDILGTVAGNPYDLEYDSSGGYLTISGNNSAVDNNLIIDAGQFRPGNNDDFNATGDVTVAGGQLYDGDETGTATFGSLTINSGGTYDATSGTTTMKGDFSNAGIFTHNDGTVTTAGTDVNISGTVDPAFYDLTIGSGTAHLKSNMTVENALTVSGSTEVDLYGYNYTFGTASAAGTIANSGTVDVGTTSQDIQLYAASESYYFTVTGTDIDWNDKSGTNWYVKWVDYDPNVDTGTGTNLNLTWDGDVIFDGFTMRNGFTLDPQSYDWTTASDTWIDGKVVSGSGYHNLHTLVTSTNADYTATSGRTRVYNRMSGNGINLGASGTFNHNNGHMEVAGQSTAQAIVVSNGATFYDLNISNTAGSYVYLKSNIVVDKDMWVESDTFDSIGYNVGVSGGVYVTGGEWNASTGTNTVGNLTISSGASVNATSGVLTINGSLFNNAGSFYPDSGTVAFNGASTTIMGNTGFSELRISGNVTDDGDSNYTVMNVTSVGNFTYNTSNYDYNVTYYKATGGYVGIASSSTLTSNTTYWNGTADGNKLTANTTGAAYFVDVIEAGSNWWVGGWNSAPTMTSADIQPDPAYTTSALLGYCRADDSESDNVTFHYQWYNNSVSVETGYNSTSLISGEEHVIHALTSGNISKGENWTFACIAQDDLANASAWINDSVLISNTAPTAFTSVVLAATNTSLNNTNQNLTVTWTDGSDSDSDAIYNITDWRLNSTSIAVLNMPFDSNRSGQSGSIVRDYSTNTNNGTLEGNPQGVTVGRIGGAYAFDGSGDYINLGATNALIGNNNQNITVSLWVNTTDTVAKYAFSLKRQSGANSTLLSVCSNYGSVGTLGFLTREYDDSGHDYMTYDGDYNDGSWHHVVAIVDGLNRYLYIDNVLRGSDALGMQDVTSNTDEATIGGFGASTTSLDFTGHLDDVKVFNRSLTPEQIDQIYNAGLAGHSVQNMSFNETVVNDTWTVAVTPNDLESDGTTTTSNSVTIINNAPSISTVDLTPDSPTTDDH
ncbi:hypothetical protein HOE41_02035, partial [Candidatus Woesearchaeota archaeon]|nr:hypothetical protein [Candidatus Woesearchaeota archaeon]